MISIQVTSKHIELGRRGECDRCPIALALIDAGFDKPMVTDEFVRASGRYYALERKIFHWIHDYDDDKKVAPIEVKLEREFPPDDSEDTT